MKTKKQSSMDRAIKNGFAIITDEEKKDTINFHQDLKNKTKQKHENIIYLILGSLLGIFGGYFATWIYEIFRGGEIKIIDILMFGGLIIVMIILNNKLMENKGKIKMYNEAIELFSKNNVVITDYEKYNKFLKNQKLNKKPKK